MTCLEVQSLIIPYIEDKLEFDQLEDFLNHVYECESCMEELEVYYILLKGIKLLDEDIGFSNDFHKDFLDKLKKTELYIHKKKSNKTRLQILALIAIVTLIILTSLQIEDILLDDNENSYHTYNETIIYTEIPLNITPKFENKKTKEIKKLISISNLNTY